MRRRRPLPVRLVLTAVAVGTAMVTPVLAGAASAGAASVCAAVDEGRVGGLTSGPAHVLFALAGGYGSSSVTLTQCARSASGAYTPLWTAAGHTGRAGFAAPGAKREGDGRTPSGLFKFGTAFGAADPGSQVGYWRLQPDSCWGSTVGSATYNRPFSGSCGPADEAMYRYVNGAYAQGLVIEYNTAPVVQGAGSAIFLHVGGGSTAGCIATDDGTVVRTIRTIQPGDVIVMGVGSVMVGGNSSPAAGSISHTLAIGSPYHEEVAVLQARLNQLGAHLARDGRFGPLTRAGVVAFQRARGLTADGIVGPRTGAALGLR